jgi:hypothetical protein
MKEMIRTLYQAAEALPDLLADRSKWQSSYLDLHQPAIERVWIFWKSFGVYLQRTHPCPADTALLFPNPSPMAVAICGGYYELGFGCAAPDDPPPEVHGPFVLGTGTVYELILDSEWTYVRPVTHPCYSLMVTEKPFRPKTDDEGKRELKEEEKSSLFQFFQQPEVQVALLGDVKRAIK